jgi:hypothetical protein
MNDLGVPGNPYFPAGQEDVDDIPDYVPESEEELNNEEGDEIL